MISYLFSFSFFLIFPDLHCKTKNSILLYQSDIVFGDSFPYLLHLQNTHFFGSVPRFLKLYVFDRGVLEDIFARYSNLAFLVQNIINDCLELPPDFLKNYNNIRNSDFLVSLYYLPASDIGNSGKSEHEDGNVVTFVLQDDIGGLEVLHNGEWIPIPPAPGTLVVNVGDVIQVLSNNKFKSATHRVVRPKGTTRNSYAFFYNLDGDKWVEPLPQFTTEIGEPPQYRGFYYKDYVKARVMDRINPPSRLEDRFCIKHYAIST